MTCGGELEAVNQAGCTSMSSSSELILVFVVKFTHNLCPKNYIFYNSNYYFGAGGNWSDLYFFLDLQQNKLGQ